MNILITSGSTSEPIDGVRSIVNSATGRLGSLIADSFARYPEIKQIYYICSANSYLPATHKAAIRRIKGTADLEATLHHALAEGFFDACVHAMAVSDYTVDKITRISEIAETTERIREEKEANYEVREAVEEAFRRGTPTDTGLKISSDWDDLVLVMKKTPKYIGQIRQISPQTLLVGFKLLNQSSTTGLLIAAYDLLKKNDCDFVLANDLSTISGDSHVGYLINREKSVKRFENKTEIANGIAEAVMQKLRGEI